MFLYSSSTKNMCQAMTTEKAFFVKMALEKNRSNFINQSASARTRQEDGRQHSSLLFVIAIYVWIRFFNR